MPRLTTPWFQQKNMTPQPLTPSDVIGPVLDGEEIEALTERLMKPTQASDARRSLHWKLDSYMDGGRHAWNKMDLCKDSRKNLWTSNGAVKKNSQTKP